MNRKGAKVWAGSLIIAGGGLMLLLGLLSPAVAEPAKRIGRVVLSGFDDARDGDLVLPADTVEGVSPGAPVYFLPTGQETVPVGHVVSVQTTEAGYHAVRVRYAPDRAVDGDVVLRVFPPRRGLSESYRLAVSPESARKVGGLAIDRLATLWREDIEPTLAERMPHFLDRLDPREDPESKAVMTGLGDEAMKRLKPLLDDLVDELSKGLHKELGLLDRMGVLWKFVRGDRKGLKKKLQPIAEQGAKEWWARNQSAVIGALGDSFKARMPEVRGWLSSEVLPAARDELLEPLLERHRERLEKEGEALMRVAMKEIIESREGGFRVRFAAMLRMTLLGKKQALLLLERPTAGND